MSYNTILVEKDGPAMVVTLNRPESRNSFSVELMGELAAAAQEGQDDPDIFGIIVTGGDKYFASGADLNEALALAGPKSVVDYLIELGEALPDDGRTRDPGHCRD